MVAITSPRVVIADTNVGNPYDFYEYPDTSCGVTTIYEIPCKNATAVGQDAKDKLWSL